MYKIHLKLSTLIVLSYLNIQLTNLIFINYTTSTWSFPVLNANTFIENQFKVSFLVIKNRLNQVFTCIFGSVISTNTNSIIDSKFKFIYLFTLFKPKQQIRYDKQLVLFSLNQHLSRKRNLFSIISVCFYLSLQ